MQDGERVCNLNILRLPSVRPLDAVRGILEWAATAADAHRFFRPTLPGGGNGRRALFTEMEGSISVKRKEEVGDWRFCDQEVARSL